ncbi:MAG: hypothetical protein AAFX81_18040 [Pseudomonadota bacterium]
MERNANVGPRYALRLGRLQDWHVLVVRCLCGHVGTVSPGPLRRDYPEHTPIQDLARKFRCRRCGVRGQRVWDVETLPRD